MKLIPITLPAFAFVAQPPAPARAPRRAGHPALTAAVTRNLVLPLACALAFLLGGSATALASCVIVSQGPPCQEFWRADAVFIGYASEVVAEPWPESNLVPWQPYRKLTARLTVEQVFRGKVGTEVTFEMSDCPYPFRQGEQYLVYAHKGPDGRLSQHTGRSRTRPVHEAAEDLAYIRNTAGAETSARIFGTVSRRDNSLTVHKRGERVSSRREPMARIKVIAEGGARSFEAVTDGDGKYELASLPEGAYRVRLELPKHLNGNGREVKTSRLGCVPLDFEVTPAGLIAGRVLNEEGQPLKDVRLSLFPADGITDADVEAGALLMPATVYTDRDGNFSFNALPAGRYGLVLNFERDESAQPAGTAAHPRTFYPGANRLSQATFIPLKEGEELRQVEFRLPPPR